MIKMKTDNMKLDGMKGSWCVIDEYHSIDGSFYLWESEQLGEDCPAVLTDDKMRVLDTCCYSGVYVALQDNGLILIDETEQEDKAMMDELEDLSLSHDWDNEREIMEMIEAFLVSGNFSKKAIVRVRFNANGYSLKIGTKSFSSHVPHVWDCISDVERLGTLGYSIEKAMADIEALS